MTTIISVWIWIASTALLVAWWPLLLVRRLLDRSPTREKTGRLFRQVGVLITKLNPLWTVRVVGAETAKRSPTPYVVVSNHQSLADIPVLSHLPWEMKWMAKKELFKLPFVGWQLKLAGDIPIERDNPRDAVKSLRRARFYLDQKCSVMVFAEGSRSPDGEVGRFLDGAFRLAVGAGVPVLPVVIDGTSDCLPKKSWIFGRTARVKVEVLAPLSTTGLKLDDVGTLRDDVRRRIVERLAEMREESARGEAMDAQTESVVTDGVVGSEAVPFPYTYESFFE